MARINLRYLQELINKQLKTMPLTECLLLNIPRELRDRIYLFVAIASIQDPNNKSEKPVSGLSRACKQTRLEFDEIIYSSKIIKIEYYDGAASDWNLIEEPRVLRALLNGKVPSFFCHPTSFDTRAALREQVEGDSKWGHIGIEGVMGLVTADEGGGLYKFRVSREELREALAG